MIEIFGVFLENIEKLKFRVFKFGKIKQSKKIWFHLLESLYKGYNLLSNKLKNRNNNSLFISLSFMDLILQFISRLKKIKIK